MKRILKTVMAFALGASLVGPSLASPVGKWEIEFKDSRYDVTMCGDGTQLCAKLIWLGNGADNPQNMPYLNTFLIEGAKQTAPSKWEGTLHLYGNKAQGTISQVGPDQLSLRGCFLLVVCKSFQMYRMAD
jgi:uncharacterized protein (DUF2147 family)